MLGFLEPGALKNLTPDAVAAGVGSNDSPIGPSITRSRPVAFLTAAMIAGL